MCNPLFDQHIEARVVENMREANVGYVKCTGNNEKEISIAALRLTVNLFHKIYNNCMTLLRENIHIFQTPTLLAIANTKIPKANTNAVALPLKNKLGS